MSNISLNFDYQIKINTTPTATTATYATIAKGFDNVAEALNEVLYQSSFLGDMGYGSSYVTGGQLIATLSGVRMIGDAAQDYIFGNETYYEWGKSRETTIIFSCPDGTIVSCPVTLAKITRAGGAANTATAITVEIHFNGKPTVINLSLATLNVGTLTLSPTFDPNILNYSITTTNATDTVVAPVNNASSAGAVIVYRGTHSGLTPEAAPTLDCTWEGTDKVIITVTNTLDLPGVKKIYTITVNHS